MAALLYSWETALCSISSAQSLALCETATPLTHIIINLSHGLEQFYLLCIDILGFRQSVIHHPFLILDDVLADAELYILAKHREPPDTLLQTFDAFLLGKERHREEFQTLAVVLHQIVSIYHSVSLRHEKLRLVEHIPQLAQADIDRTFLQGHLHLVLHKVTILFQTTQIWKTFLSVLPPARRPEGR